jgi:ketosteroid isomerase-like protein
MSQENVDLVRRAYADPRGLAAAVADRVAPDAAFDFSEAYPDGPVVRGLDAARRFRADVPWAELSFEPEHVIEVDDERVLVLVDVTAVGRGSGVPTDIASAHVLTFRDGLLTHLKVYANRADALRAAGLDNVELVRRFLVLDADEALVYADPDIVWNPVEEAPGRGHDAVRASLDRWKGEWDDYELDTEDFADLGDQVLATVCMRGRGKGSGIVVEARLYDLYTVRDGQIVRMDQFSERSEALGAAHRLAR